MKSVYENFKNKLVKAYKQLKIGDPLDAENHVGPLIDKDAVQMYLATPLKHANKQGGKFLSRRRNALRERLMKAGAM